MKSINARFEGEISPDEEFPTPPGASLARHMMRQLWDAGWQSTEFNPWKKRGWVLPVTLADIRLDLILWRHPKKTTQWDLTIEPSYVPGFFARFDGNVVSAGPADMHMLAKTVHEVLSNFEEVVEVRWGWNGPPSKKNATLEPTELG